ncbi:MAG: sterol desaturase family protein [Merismopediaceae bacterium]|nr:sterol desaturase family protein [Merismopediaceae bacterium]
MVLMLILAVCKGIGVAVLLLFLGDFFSTFFYHVPEHIFGKFHALVHHSNNRSFLHYAVLTRNPLVLIDGLLGALPYFIFIPWLWRLSPWGTILGLLLGELHVIWRHVSVMDWQTPPKLLRLCNFLQITTPERHWLHHQDARVAFGDIFNFFDPPAQWWLKQLTFVKYKLKASHSLGNS